MLSTPAANGNIGPVRSNHPPKETKFVHTMRICLLLAITQIDTILRIKVDFGCKKKNLSRIFRKSL